MTRISQLCIAAIFTLATLAVATNALAADGDVFVSPPKTLVGTNSKVNVGEIQVEIEIEGQLRPYFTAYFVDVIDPVTQVAAFAVSGDAIVATGNARLRAGSRISGWAGVGLTPAEWDAGYEFSILGATSITTSSLGAATDLFGHDPSIFLFYITEGNSLLAEPDHDQDEDTWFVDPIGNPSLVPFSASTFSRSEFMALDINGQVVDFSVPEPGTATIAAVALLALATRRIKWG